MNTTALVAIAIGFAVLAYSYATIVAPAYAAVLAALR
jgi:hypothetical protein